MIWAKTLERMNPISQDNQPRTHTQPLPRASCLHSARGVMLVVTDLKDASLQYVCLPPASGSVAALLLPIRHNAELPLAVPERGRGQEAEA